MALLSVRDLTVRFGGIVALDGVSFDVEKGITLGLIGPNGAGKTTLFNAITRIYKPESGDILFEGQSLLRSPRHDIVRHGIARTFQNLELFRRMSVLDNVLVGRHTAIARSRWYFLPAALGLPGVRRAERRARERALAILEDVGIADVAHRPVAGLPFGTLKAVELARGLASDPRLLLLDEPAGGLNHEEVAELVGLIKHIQKRYDLTLLIVEHHMNLVMKVSDQVVVLDFGKKIAEGSPREVQEDQRVIAAYLGTAEEDGAA